MIVNITTVVGTYNQLVLTLNKLIQKHKMFMITNIVMIRNNILYRSITRKYNKDRCMYNVYFKL